MSILYKSKEEQNIELEFNILEDNKVVLEFYSDCGKFGMYEPLAGFKLTFDRLLQILSERDDITDEEYDS